LRTSFIVVYHVTGMRLCDAGASPGGLFWVSFFCHKAPCLRALRNKMDAETCCRPPIPGSKKMQR